MGDLPIQQLAFDGAEETLRVVGMGLTPSKEVVRSSVVSEYEYYSEDESKDHEVPEVKTLPEIVVEASSEAEVSPEAKSPEVPFTMSNLLSSFLTRNSVADKREESPAKKVEDTQ